MPDRKLLPRKGDREASPSEHRVASLLATGGWRQENRRRLRGPSPAIAKCLRRRIARHLSRRLVSLVSAPAIALALAGPGRAQVVPDGSLSTTVEQSGAIFQVEGGDRAGDNLFHSFREFSVPTGFEVQFRNAPEIRNIFSRVTGDAASAIDGWIRANGSANLFLLNPNGIAFGPNARLDLGGAFVAATAERVDFADGGSFGPLDPGGDRPLLSASVPVGLQAGTGPGAIHLAGPGHGLDLENPTLSAADGSANAPALSIAPGRSLALVGGAIAADGGRVQAEDGRIDLVALGDGGRARLEPDPSGFRAFETSGPLAAIALENRSVLDTSGDRGGAIGLVGSRFAAANDSRVLAETRGNGPGRDIAIAVETLELTGNAFVSASTFGPGRGGNLRATASTIDVAGVGELQDVLRDLFALTTIEEPAQIGGGLFASSFGSGDAGQLDVTVDRLTLRNSSFISTAAYGSGGGGQLDVRATGDVALLASEIFADSFGDGDAGDVTLTGRSIRFEDGGGVFASTFGRGNGGTLTVRAAESVEIAGATPNGVYTSAIVTNAYSQATGTAGNILVEAPVVRLTEGTSIGAATFGAGRGGSVIIRAPERLIVSGTGNELSNINTRSQGTGAAGNILIEAGDIILRGGGSIFTSTLNIGQAGALTVRATGTLDLAGQAPNGFPSSLRSDATTDAAIAGNVPQDSPAARVGLAGSLDLSAREIRLRDGAEIAVSSLVPGETDRAAGNLTLNVERLVLQDGARIAAETAAGQGGNLFLDANQIELRRGSTLTANATNAAGGGNLFIRADTLVALENSDITANAIEGLGGQIEIDASGIFGAEARDRTTPESDITASSDRGAAFEGTVTVVATEVDPNATVGDLPEDTSDPSDRIIVGCAAASGNSFVAVGRGGLPEDPTAPVDSASPWQDWHNALQDLDSDRQNAADPDSVAPALGTGPAEAERRSRNTPEGDLRREATSPEVFAPEVFAPEILPENSAPENSAPDRDASPRENRESARPVLPRWEASGWRRDREGRLHLVADPVVRRARTICPTRILPRERSRSDRSRSDRSRFD